MKKNELKAEKIGGAGMTSKILFIVPIKINESWIWYESKKGFVKSAKNQEEIKKIQEEVLSVCDDK